MTSCVRCQSALETDDLRCPVCAAATPDLSRQVSSVTVTVLRCTTCGAAVSYDAERKAPHCAFCGSTMRVEQTVDPLDQAQHALPFAVNEVAAREALATFLGGGGFFHPGDLAQASGVKEMKPIFWASWVFDAEADVAYATDTNAGSGRSSWAPYAGMTRMRFDHVAVSASRGLTQAESHELVTGYDLNTARDIAYIETLGPPATPAERFELQRSAARRLVANAIESVARGRVTNGLAPGSRFRNTHVSLVLRGLVTRRVLFPAWILSYTYADKPYRVVVHGQRPEIVLGERPLSIARVLAVIVAVVLVILIALSVLAMAS